MPSNPLMPRPMHPKPHPAQNHANMWKMVQGIPKEDLADKIRQIDEALPLLGELAGNPNITRKNVIKAVADAGKSGKIPASSLVSMLTQMPDDPDKIQPWLKSLYGAYMSTAVHMKAAAMPPPGNIQ
jgi:hypothetical protein